MPPTPAPVHLDLEMERAVLGSLMLDLRLLAEVAPRLSPDDFGDPQHAAIYGALQHLVGSGSLAVPQADLLLVESVLRDLGQWERPVQQAALLACYDQLTNPANLPEYADAIRQHRRWRDVAQTLRVYTEKVTRGRGDPSALLMALQGELVTAATSIEGRQVLPIHEVYADWLADMERRQARPTPFSDYPFGFSGLDMATLGLEPGDDCVIGAPTGAGKTAFGLNLAIRWASMGTAVLLCSLEMTHKQIYNRLLVLVSGLNNYLVRAGKHANGEPWTAEESRQLAEAHRIIAAMAPIYVIPPQRMGVGELRSMLALHRRQHERMVVLVDYFQKMRPSGRTDSAAQAYGMMSGELKQTALEFEVPLVLISQLSRPPREGRHPSLHDYKESGGIENDANQGMILARVPEKQRYPEEETVPGHPRLVELHLLKQREGREGRIRLLFRGENYRFGEIPARSIGRLDDEAWKKISLKDWRYPIEDWIAPYR